MKESSAPKIRLLLVDDHPIVLDGLRANLSKIPWIDILGVASNGNEAVNLAIELKPDVVLMDLSLPELNGFEATRLIREQLPKTRVLILTMHESEEYVRQVVGSGAHGYLLKNAAPATLLQAIQSVAADQAFFSPQVSSVLFKEISRTMVNRPRSTEPELSGRETEVVAMIAEEMANKEIAKELGVSVRTVETYRERIFKKLGVRTVAGLVKYAIARGLVKI